MNDWNRLAANVSMKNELPMFRMTILTPRFLSEVDMRVWEVFYNLAEATKAVSFMELTCNFSMYMIRFAYIHEDIGVVKIPSEEFRKASYKDIKQTINQIILSAKDSHVYSALPELMRFIESQNN